MQDFAAGVALKDKSKQSKYAIVLGSLCIYFFVFVILAVKWGIVFRKERIREKVDQRRGKYEEWKEGPFIAERAVVLGQEWSPKNPTVELWHLHCTFPNCVTFGNVTQPLGASVP